MSDNDQTKAIADFVCSLAAGHNDLNARIKTVAHSAKSASKRVKLHAHYLAFRDGQPTMAEFVEILSGKLINFCLPRKNVIQEQKDWEKLPPDKVMERVIRLQNRAVDLFKRANVNSNRNGEFGEVITYLLIESVLKAPQFVAKMSLKTSPQMPVHGSDGIHLSYDAEAGELKLYWGESKCYASVQAAIDRAAESVAENLTHEKMSHELFLIEQYFDLSGFPENYREAILSFLNPYDDRYNQRADVSVMFISFDFEAFAVLKGVDQKEIEAKFVEELNKVLPGYAARIDEALAKHEVKSHSVEIFFLPVPSVNDLRTQFQKRIGWNT